MASPKSVTVTIRPTISDEFIQAMRQVAEAFNEVADRMAELNDGIEAEESNDDH